MSEGFWEYGLGQTRRTRRFKRAQTACHRCRAKKTKCDNKRPSCGLCRENHAQCVYGDLASGQQVQPEPTMRDIYNRLNHIADLLETDRPPAADAPTAATAAVHDGLSRRPLDTDSAHTASPTDGHSRYTSSAGLSPSDVSRGASTPAGISFESTLKWPIFGGLALDCVSSLVLQTNFPLGESSPRKRVDDDDEVVSAFDDGRSDQPDLERLSNGADILLLCQRYLKVVHVKNPIFELCDFNADVKRVMENGLGWDAGSCVVMLACALASVVKHVRESSDGLGSSPPLTADGSVSQPAESRYTCGDSYYLAAKMRLGLLGVTLTSVQCFLMAGLYEMCRMKPANAWLHYSQACSRLHMILAQHELGEHAQSPRFHILERLYFSCYRTEMDLREELHLPPSGITNFEFPSEFPSLPSWTLHNGANRSSVVNTMPNMPQGCGSNVVQKEDEQSWYYYLASIALRKEANSIIHLLYTQGELGWMENVEHMVHQAALQESELNQWRTLLPTSLRLDADEEASEDLAFILECRELHWRQISHRPLLYYALHRPETDPHYTRVLPLAMKCLEYCGLTIRRLVRPHQFETSWFIQRAIATAALLILAARIRGPPLVVLDWEDLVSSSLRALDIWRADAQDLDWACQILEKIFTEVSQGRE